MSLSSILVLFLTHLGIGIVFTLLVVSSEAGLKFFRFNVGLALALLVSGLAFRPLEPLALGPSSVALVGLVGVVCALGVYRVTAGRAFPALRPVLLWAAAAGGLVVLFAQAVEVAAQSLFVFKVLTVASFISSAALLGGACTAMVLGHWYLVLPSMRVSHLQAMVKFHIVSTVLRVVVVGAAVFMAIATFEPLAGPSFERYILSSRGIFFWQRLLFGLLGPIALSWMTWETAKINATQSATGILYVDFFTVIVGEILAKYLVLSTSVPV